LVVLAPVALPPPPTLVCSSAISPLSLFTSTFDAFLSLSMATSAALFISLNDVNWAFIAVTLSFSSFTLACCSDSICRNKEFSRCSPCTDDESASTLLLGSPPAVRAGAWAARPARDLKDKTSPLSLRTSRESDATVGVSSKRRGRG